MNKTFEQIVPRWSKTISDFGIDALLKRHPNGITLDMCDMRTCILGEAWKWNSDYNNNDTDKYCSECAIHGWEFYYTALAIPHETNKNRIQERFNNNKEGFVEHWNENHENV